MRGSEFSTRRSRIRIAHSAIHACRVCLDISAAFESAHAS